MGVGVTAFGSIFTAVDNPNDNYVRLGVSVGYDTLPRILSSNSTAKTAKIDVQSQFVDIVDLARRAFDSSTNALGGYTEATRAVKLNRKAIAKHMRDIVEEGKPVDALFVRDFLNLIQAELKLNNAYHGIMKAFALMRRLLVTEETDALRFLPPSHETEKIQRLFLAEFPGYSPKGSHLDRTIRDLHHASDLSNLLNGQYTNVDRVVDDFGKDTMKEIVSDNMSALLHRTPWRFKRKGFYLVLNQYIEENKLHISEMEKRKLLHRAGMPVEDIEFGKERDHTC